MVFFELFPTEDLSCCKQPLLWSGERNISRISLFTIVPKYVAGFKLVPFKVVIYFLKEQKQGVCDLDELLSGTNCRTVAQEFSTNKLTICMAEEDFEYSTK